MRISRRRVYHPFLPYKRFYTRPTRSFNRRLVRPFQSRRALTFALLATIGIFALLGWFGLSWLKEQSPSEEVARSYSVTGDATIDATFIDRVLSHYHSPAAGKGQALYDYGNRYHIDPVFALAFFLQESSFGTQGIATVTHSLGNIRATPGQSTATYTEYKGYRMYRTWEAGFEDWYRLIARQYVEQWGLVTVDQIIPVYAPASDHNDEKAYIRTVKLAVDTWRKGEVTV
ncbi:MAG: glucosaminidase domain-containing protein [Ktedonobacteraceae bacterium]|nr:glucosaminidase domain-containing protein [Ktedonobacteraceae bacterium]